MTIFYLEKPVLVETGEKDELGVAIRLCPKDRTRVIMLSAWTHLCPTCRELHDIREPQCPAGHAQNEHCKTSSLGRSGQFLFHCETHGMDFGHPGEFMVQSETAPKSGGEAAEHRPIPASET